MKLQQRISLLLKLGAYIRENSAPWQEACHRAGLENGWFTEEFVQLSTSQIANNWLQKEALEKWVASYPIQEGNLKPLNVGLVMAGNLPLVGFHDWLCVFITGNKAIVKPSSKDQVLIKHIFEKLTEWDANFSNTTVLANQLKGCDAYIATGSNNSSRYFEYYFNKYPHIIRKNRTSIAVLTGKESKEELEKLADDVHLYFGLGCRNVTKLYVPVGYDFVPLIDALKKYQHLADHHKLKNNYDYNLALHILNKKYYMTNGTMLLIEDSSLFSPISQLNYSYYENLTALEKELVEQADLQCRVGHNGIPFGNSQYPTLTDYADGVDTLKWLTEL
jgi:hypothetical protein